MLERSGSTAFGYDMHGGADRTRVQWYFLDRTRLPVAVHLWELPPGGAEGMHSHDESDPLEELYLVVDGSGIMRVDDQTYDLRAGDAVLAPVGSEHDLHNTGTDTLRVVVVWGRPAIDDEADADRAAADWSNFGTARASRRARAEQA